MSERRPSETERVRGIWERLAPTFDRQISFWEKILFEGAREWVCSRAQGDVLEIAVGSGRNLGYYPPGTRLVGIELSPAMLAVARERAVALDRDVDLRVGDAQSVEFEDESFDTVVCTISLCSIPDHRKAIAEARRVLRPRGAFVYFEHVGSPARPVRLVQHALNPLTVRFQGDHLTRRPLKALREAGFEIEEVHRSKWGIVERGVARKAPGPSG